jgi:hypothetical protein
LAKIAKQFEQSSLKINEEYSQNYLPQTIYAPSQKIQPLQEKLSV